LLAAKAAYDKYTNPSEPLSTSTNDKKVFNSLKDKIDSQKIEPQLDVSNRPTQMEPSFDNSQPVQEAKQVAPTLEELKAKFGLPSEPVQTTTPTVTQTSTTPSLPASPTPAEVVTNPVATPVEKAVELTKEAPKEGVAPPRAARGSLATIANNPAPVEGMPGMRENYTKPKGINPATGEPFIGSGGYNWLHNNLGPERAPIAYEEQYGKINVPYKQVESDYSATRYPPTRETIQAKSGGDFGKPKYIPDYIKGNASIGGMANAGINALGVAGLVSDYKEAKKTGDWSNFGQNATGQIIANVLPKAALATQLASYSKELGESPEELKSLGKKLQDAQQATKIGAGRGMQGVPPPAR